MVRQTTEDRLPVLGDFSGATTSKEEKNTCSPTNLGYVGFKAWGGKVKDS